jgi:hypothetical protein
MKTAKSLKKSVRTAVSVMRFDTVSSHAIGRGSALRLTVLVLIWCHLEGEPPDTSVVGADNLPESLTKAQCQIDSQHLTPACIPA